MDSSPPKIIRAPQLGAPQHPSPLRHPDRPGVGASKFVPENCFVRQQLETLVGEPAGEEWLFEKAGPREKLFFDPAKTKAAVVTCGGLSPGLNNVIRSLFLELRLRYGVGEVLGIRYGYEGLNPQVAAPPLTLTPEFVEHIHENGGTVLGSSRGAQEPAVMVDYLAEREINALFCVGGDGTQRGAHQIAEEAARRKLPLAVVGIPKTIDNDVLYCDRTFGYSTALSEAQKVLLCAHIESKGMRNGIGLVKLMGRESGFIAAGATLASQEVNFTLIPELPFALDGPHGFLNVLRERMIRRGHAVIAVAEGAGQDLFPQRETACDASGNVKFRDIGLLLKQKILDYFARHGPAVGVKYFEPSYIIRSVPANCEDDILCDQFARRAVHAALAGKTDVFIGLMNSTFVHVPLALAIGRMRYVRVDGEFWNSVLATTGQPPRFYA
ncbi:MAG: ATP-dependent 6-phosphofructokinase [Pirellulales bacterium]|nr:ATP-dependent 6-phosphofructokinase [Pirellulales bacterium]